MITIFGYHPGPFAHPGAFDRYLPRIFVRIRIIYSLLTYDVCVQILKALLRCFVAFLRSNSDNILFFIFGINGLAALIGLELLLFVNFSPFLQIILGEQSSTQLLLS